MNISLSGYLNSGQVDNRSDVSDCTRNLCLPFQAMRSVSLLTIGRRSKSTVLSAYHSQSTGISLRSSMSGMASSSDRVSYPKPTTPSPFPYPLIAPPPYIPYRSAPPPTSLPRLPSRLSLPPLPPGWSRTTHIVPAAYPRQFAESSGTLVRESKPYQLEPPKQDETREERLARNEGEARECLRGRYDATRAQGDEEGLYMAAERWVRDGSKGEGVMLVVTHANGFTKEVRSSILYKSVGDEG